MQKIEDNPSLPPTGEDVLLQIEIIDYDNDPINTTTEKKWYFGFRYLNGEGGYSFKVYNFIKRKPPFNVVAWKPLPNME